MNRAFFLAVSLFLTSAWAQEEPKIGPKPEPRTPPPTTLTIEGEVDEDMAKIAGQLTTLFYECYPKLLKRFESEEKFAARKIKLVFKKGIKVPGYSHRDTVTVSVDWFKKHPEDLGLFTHELTHLVQDYPKSDPGWLTEGIADYARHLYGPEKQPGWSLPRRLQPEQSYKNSYGVTARFLVWLDEKHPGTVDKIHRQMQATKFNVEDLVEFTGKDIDTLWRECVQELNR